MGNVKSRNKGKIPEEQEEEYNEGDLTIRRTRSKFYEQYTQKHLLGKGHFAQVFLGINQRTKENVAIKRINLARTKSKHIIVEVQALAKVGKHRNVIELFGVFDLESSLVLVLELCTGGELFDRLVEGPYTEEECAKHFRDICSAMSFLHKNGVVHRDLKPENILLSSKSRDAILKIADFGLAKILDDPTSSDSFVMKSRVGTWMYAAPEVRRPLHTGQFGYTNKVDVWSCGVILYVMLAGYHPFDPFNSRTPQERRTYIESGHFTFGNEKIWGVVSQKAKNLIRKMITVDPEKRPTIEDVIRDEWLVSPPATPLAANKELSVFQDNYKKHKKIIASEQQAFDTPEITLTLPSRIKK